MNCLYHHELHGWLPLLPDESAADNCRDEINANDLPIALVFAEIYVACPCSPLWAENDDLAVTNLDIWRTEAVTEMAVSGFIYDSRADR